MRCRKCGADLSDDLLYCPECGEEIRIVPDYSSLDDILAAHVKGEFEEKPRKAAEPRRTSDPRKAAETRRTAEAKPAVKQTARSPRKKKNSSKKKMLIILGSLLAAMLIGFFLYQNSYGGLIQKGYNALKQKNYNASIRYFERAAKKDSERADAYTGLSKVYLKQDDADAAEDVFLTQIEEQPKNADIYEAAIQFYLDTEQNSKIPVLLSECEEDKVLDAMSDYVVDPPAFSLEEETYEEEQKLELTADGNQIYYTLDETEPTEKKGTRYGTEIELDEGEWTVKAIAVNKKGIPSLVAEKTYQIDIPLLDPPIVAPSSGLYESEMEITVQAKEGYTVYYVFGETEPTESNWKKYTGPIPMPEGNRIFSAVYVEDSTGKVSAATVRNYDLHLNSQDDTAEEE